MIRKTLLTFALLLSGSVTQANAILTENFDDITTLGGNGWAFANNSTPGGSTSYFQGNTGIFGSQSGAANSYIGANFNNAPLGGNISNWLISPTLTLFNNETLTFFTRTDVASTFADRLEVRVSVNGASTNVGNADDSVGDFSMLLATINPTLTPAGYPSDWTAFSVTFTGISNPTLGRFAFRYFVPDTSINGNYIGIDTLSVTVPEPGSLALFGLALLPFAWTLRRRTRVTRLTSVA